MLPLELNHTICKIECVICTAATVRSKVLIDLKTVVVNVKKTNRFFAIPKSNWVNCFNEAQGNKTKSLCKLMRVRVLLRI